MNAYIYTALFDLSKQYIPILEGHKQPKINTEGIMCILYLGLAIKLLSYSV